MQQIIVGISYRLRRPSCFLGCCTTDTRKSTDTRLQKRNTLSVISGVWILFGVGNFVSGYFPECSVDERSIYQELDDRAQYPDYCGGILVNTKGIVGLFPVLATLIWTIANYYFRDVFYVKIFLLINIALWTIYFFVIWDFSSGIAQVVMGMICVISLYRISARRVSHT